MKKMLMLAVVLFLLVGCYPSSGNLEQVKANAHEVWLRNGYTVDGYMGYQFGTTYVFFPEYGGAYVWYTLKRNPDNGISYKGAIQRWGNEYHVYSTQAIDAIAPTGK